MIRMIWKRNSNSFIYIDHVKIWEFYIIAKWNSWGDNVNIEMGWCHNESGKKNKFLRYARSYYHVASIHNTDNA